ncbi:MAG: NifU family protein, partial [Candidatus Ornithospirochaeta sp.]|nr:NifU family protein [Candidatus Ornithospirochaeta sp.]
FVRLVGACAGCPMSQLTLTNGVQRYIRETVSPDITIINEDM